MPSDAARADDAAARLLERRVDVARRWRAAPARCRTRCRSAPVTASDEARARASRAATAWPGGAGQQLLAPVADQRCRARRRSPRAAGSRSAAAESAASRVAPSDSRTEISFCRAVARDSSRLATLAQTISSTSATTTLRIVDRRAARWCWRRRCRGAPDSTTQPRHLRAVAIAASRRARRRVSDCRYESSPARAVLLEHALEIALHLCRRRARLQPAHDLQPPVGRLTRAAARPAGGASSCGSSDERQRRCPAARRPAAERR